VLIVDTSGSMNYPRTKIRDARRAAAAAVDAIRDGVRFAVIEGYERASVAYPPDGGTTMLAESSVTTRDEAKRAIARLNADGGTSLGAWLRTAEGLFGYGSATVRQALLLTDGRNESESSADLEVALGDCEGRFQCECRGVGADWDVDELRRISSRLLGSVDIITEPSAMVTELEAMMHAAMAKQTGDVALRIWTPAGARLRFVKQVMPDIHDLTTTGVEVDARTADHAVGAWSPGETRDYHVCVELPAGEEGDDMVAARVAVVADGAAGTPAMLRAVWTDDIALSTRIDRSVAHYTGQAELADAIQEGVRARHAGDTATATRRLGRAVQLATACGDERKVEELRRIVDIDDAEAGTVRLRSNVDKVDEMVLDTRSVKTLRIADERTA
jgi:hypothetical protein